MRHKKTFKIFTKRLVLSGVFAVIFFSASTVFAASKLSKPVFSSVINPTHSTMLELTLIYKNYILPPGSVNTTTVSDLTSIYKNYIIEPANTSPAPSLVTPPINDIPKAMPTTLELSTFYKNYVTPQPIP